MIDTITFRCRLCWAEFESPVALLEHEALEDDRLYDLDLSEAGES